MEPCQAGSFRRIGIDSAVLVSCRRDFTLHSETVFLRWLAATMQTSSVDPVFIAGFRDLVFNVSFAHGSSRCINSRFVCNSPAERGYICELAVSFVGLLETRCSVELDGRDAAFKDDCAAQGQLTLKASVCS